MKKIVIAIVGLLAIFSILRVYTEEKKERFTFYPSLIEYADENNELKISFGLIDTKGSKTKTWEIFPIRISLRSGKNTFYLGLNGISLLTQSGINFEKHKIINNVYKGDVISFGGKVTVNSRVEGNIWVFNADVVLKPGSVVVGNVHAVGGNIIQSDKAYIYGNKNAIPEISLPFIGIITGAHSASTMRFIVEIFNIVLFLFILFLISFFRLEYFRLRVQNLFNHWRGTILYLLFSLLIIPITLFLLVATIIGVIFIPVIFIFIIVFAYYGFLTVTTRIGRIFFRKETDSLAHYLLCGLIGIFILKGPILLGILLSLLDSEIINVIGSFFKILGTSAIFLAFLYGFGSSLLNIRQRN